MSFYKKDLDNDVILTAYLDKLYSKAGLKYSRSKTADEQHCGIDLYLYKAGRSVKVDEKAQVHYLNQSLPTFAFEIGYLKDGVHKKGWLFDEHKTTECYFLVVHIYVDGDQLSSSGKIKSCRVLQVERQTLINVLKGLKIDYDKCFRAEDQFRKTGRYGRIKIRDENRFSFNLNEFLDEKPFNLVIRLDFLETFSKWLI